MIAVALPNTVVETSNIELPKGVLNFGWPWPQLAQTIPPLIFSGPLNAIFDEGISWEDAEWQ